MQGKVVRASGVPTSRGHTRVRLRRAVFSALGASLAAVPCLT